MKLTRPEHDTALRARRAGRCVAVASSYIHTGPILYRITAFRRFGDPKFVKFDARARQLQDNSTARRKGVPHDARGDGCHNFDELTSYRAGPVAESTEIRSRRAPRDV
jgi:hypothetical protein